jgi:hypothetical protein
VAILSLTHFVILFPRVVYCREKQVYVMPKTKCTGLIQQIGVSEQRFATHLSRNPYSETPITTTQTIDVMYSVFVQVPDESIEHEFEHKKIDTIHLPWC